MILAIETSSPKAGLALWNRDSHRLIHEETFSTNRAHNSVIFGYAQRMLEKSGRSIDGIAVGLGPGSYSGVRVGIALANGLSLAMKIPVIGISSLPAYGPDSKSGPTFAVVGDARRKTRFIALIINGKLKTEPELIPEDEFPDRLYELKESEQIPFIYTPDSKVAEEIPDAELSRPTAPAIARLAAESRLPWQTGLRLEPHYLRPPYITTPKKR